jgi:hypothetical protein
MSDPTKPNAPQDDWIEVGQRRAAAQQHAAAAPHADGPPPEPRVLARRAPTPPGTICLRVGVVSLFVMLAAYIFADIREVEVPWQRQFRIGYVLMFVPALGVLWGVIAFVKREAGDLRRAIVGIVLSVAALGLGAAIISARSQERDAQPVAGTERTDMTPAELAKWREEKLRRTP